LGHDDDATCISQAAISINLSVLKTTSIVQNNSSLPTLFTLHLHHGEKNLRIVKGSGHLLVFFIMVADHSASWCSMTTTLISRVQVQDQHVYNDINYSKRLLVPTHL
jgi:hypothetical protein